MNSNTKTMQAVSQGILSQIKAYGASDAEVFVYSGVAREVTMRDGAVEKAESASGNSISVRAYLGKRSAAASFSFDPSVDYSSDLEDLVTAAKLSPEDPYSGIADPDQLQQAEALDLDLYDDTPLLDIDALKARALALEKAATGKEVIVDQSESYHSRGAHYYVATNGFENFKQTSSAGQGVVVIHQGKELVRESASSAKIYLEDLESVEETGERAYRRAYDARNPKRGPSGNFPVLFDERVSSSLITHLLSAMNAASIARRASWLIDYDEEVFPANWQIIETPHRKRQSTSSIYDGEGFIKKEQAIVSCGRPLFWISNLSAARQLGEPTSGHAIRSGVSTSSGVRSIKLDAPFEARDALIKEMGDGLLVTGFIGATINAHNGDYSRGVNGFWIRNGEIAEPVNEMTIASNLKAMLPSLRAADDADPDRAYVVPSLLISEMTIAGA